MPELTDINGVSDSRADDLREEGFVTVDDVATANEEEITEVSGIGSATAGDLIESAQEVITESTLEREEDDDEEDEDPVTDLEESAVEEEDEVTLEDLEELNEESTDGEPDGEVTAEDDDGEPEEVDVTPEEADVTIEVTAEEYDYLLYAIVDMRMGRINVSHRQENLANELLEAIRPLGGAGEATLTLNEAEINAFHALLTQSQTTYQGENITSAFNAVRSVTRQVQEVREEDFGY